MAVPFLTARWRNLIVVNFEIDPDVLTPFLPLGTELDLFDNKALVSLVVFNFEENKLFGLIPTFPVSHFEEMNLRFYVRRKVGDEVRRGVVFVKEVVPSRLIAVTARTLYNEPYEARPMAHDFLRFHDQGGGTLSYSLKLGVDDVTVAVTTAGDLQPLVPHSVEDFILEHYWGYTKQDDGKTSEYRVQHEPWMYWAATEVRISGEWWKLYPPIFHPFLNAKPHSTFVARGSAVAVYAFRRFLPPFDRCVFPNPKLHGYVLYDGRCGFCSWLVPMMDKRLAEAGFGTAPLQASWVKESIPLPEEELARHLRILLTAGSTGMPCDYESEPTGKKFVQGVLVSGADAYLYAMRRMRWIWPLGFILAIPVMRWLTWRVYKLVNRNRFLISKACRLPSEL